MQGVVNDPPYGLSLPASGIVTFCYFLRTVTTCFPSHSQAFFLPDLLNFSAFYVLSAFYQSFID